MYPYSDHGDEMPLAFMAPKCELMLWRYNKSSATGCGEYRCTPLGRRGWWVVVRSIVGGDLLIGHAFSGGNSTNGYPIDQKPFTYLETSQTRMRKCFRQSLDFVVTQSTGPWVLTGKGRISAGENMLNLLDVEFLGFSKSGHFLDQ